jgi:hypothetical protein
LTTERTDLNNVIIRIDSPLRNIRLSDSLDALIGPASEPIGYSIER